MQYDQFKGMLDRAIAVLATMFINWLVLKGWLGESNAAQLSPLAAVLIPALFWGWWVNRDKALIQSAGNVVGEDGKKTVILASPELAASTPDRNIISNEAAPTAIAAAVEAAHAKV
jgi:hypothetical protein